MSFNATMRDGLKTAGVKSTNYKERKITPQEAAKRFMIDILRPAITSFDVRNSLSTAEEKFELKFDSSTVFQVASKSGVKEMTLEELIPMINRHNLCISSSVFPNIETQAFVYDSSYGQEVEKVFNPVEGEPWGFSRDDACIAWYRQTINEVDVISAIVVVPGYRLYAIKDRSDNKGILLEDTDRQHVFVPFGEYSEIFEYKTKADYLKESRPKITPENYTFHENDFFLVVTKDDNFSTNEKLRQVPAKDVLALRDRFKETGKLDSKTCYIEDMVTIDIPWIAYFKRKFYSTNQELYIAYVGAPGYELDEIVQGDREQKIRPCIYVKDANGERIKIFWLNYHECLSYKDYETWKNAPERVKRRKNFRKSRYPGVAGHEDRKPLMSEAAQDAAKFDDDNNFDMGSLDNVTPIKQDD